MKGVFTQKYTCLGLILWITLQLFSYHTYAQLNGTYTINSAVTTAGTNFNNFTACANALNTQGVSGPVTINVINTSGPYTEKVVFGDIPGASATNTIRINGNGRTIQYNATSTTDLAVITLDKTKYMTINNLHIKSLNTTMGWAVHLKDEVHHDSIINCHVDMTSLTVTNASTCNGIVATYDFVVTNYYMGGIAYNLTIEGNTIEAGPTTSGGAYCGIIVNSGANEDDNNNESDSIVIRNNEIYNFELIGISVRNAIGTKIIDNNIHRSTKTNVLSNGVAIQTITGSGEVITGNKIHDMSSATISNNSANFTGISASYSQDITRLNPALIANNIIYNVHSFGGTTIGIDIDYSQTMDILHNTVVYDKILTGSGTMYGIRVYRSSNFKISNNIVQITEGNQGQKVGFYIFYCHKIDQQNNNFYVNSNQSGLQYYGNKENINYATMAAFKTAHPTLEIESISVDANFANANIGNLLPNNNLLYSAGQYALNQVPTDIQNSPRKQSPTSGAFERVPNLTNNATASYFVSPFDHCEGNYPVKVVVANTGTNTINNLTVNWSVNGIAQPSVPYSGTLVPINATGNNSAEVLLGNFNFNYGVEYKIKAWTSLPNSMADSEPMYDTIYHSTYAGLGGYYTVNSGAATAGNNFNNFNALANALNTFGICSPVTIEVVPGSGPYTERFLLEDIKGTSEINTIKLIGNGETIQSTITNINDNGIVVLNGTRFMTIDSLTSKTLSLDLGIGFVIGGNAYKDSILRCNIDVTSVENITSNYWSAGGISLGHWYTTTQYYGHHGGSEIYIADNVITGHSTSGRCMGFGIGTNNYGGSAYYNNQHKNNIAERNKIHNFSYYGIWNANGGNLDILYNELTKSEPIINLWNYYTYAIISYSYYNHSGTLINGNKIHDINTHNNNSGNFYGIYHNSNTAYNNYQFRKRDIISNNIFYNNNVNSGQNHMNIYSINSYNTLIAHNTIHININNQNTYPSYGIYVQNNVNYDSLLDIKNNIITYLGGGVGDKYGIYLNNNINNIADRMQGNVIYFNTSQAGAQNWGRVGATDYPTLTAFRTAFPTAELNSVSVNPQYANVALGNLTPMNAQVHFIGDNLLDEVPLDIMKVERLSTPTPGAYEINANNAGTRTLISPSGNYCAGWNEIFVQIENAGSNDLDSVRVNWSVDGVPYPTVYYVGAIPGTFSSSSNVVTVNLGFYYMPVSTPVELKVWTSHPNGQQDIKNGNDTMVTTLFSNNILDVFIGNDTTICEGYPFTIEAGSLTNPTYNYLWDNFTTAAHRTVTTAGTYYVKKTMTNADCVGYDTIVVNTYPVPSVDLGSDTNLCSGVIYTLDAGTANINNDKLWSDNSTGQTLDVSQTGTYNVVVTNEFGCEDSDAINVFYTINPQIDGINTVYMLDLTYNFNIINPLFVDKVYWDFGDGSPTDTGHFVTHQYKKHGFYTVSVMLTAVCEDGDPVINKFTLDAIGNGMHNNDLIHANVKLHPNPAKEYITITIDGNSYIQGYELYNILGQKIATENYGMKESQVRINTSGMASGMYNLKILTENGIVTRKFEIVE